jgi:hypothetical protein
MGLARAAWIPSSSLEILDLRGLARLMRCMETPALEAFDAAERRHPCDPFALSYTLFFVIFSCPPRLRLSF